ncbi:hypothetical protein FRAHR75_500033 [Frankia sp. Hr75.2]|nr:hypothetical protein FRAHR75_500033 [Frankia sp. Hr75.2]
MIGAVMQAAIRPLRACQPGGDGHPGDIIRTQRRRPAQPRPAYRDTAAHPRRRPPTARGGGTGNAHRARPRADRSNGSAIDAARHRRDSGLVCHDVSHFDRPYRKRPGSHHDRAFRPTTAHPLPECVTNRLLSAP